MSNPKRVTSYTGSMRTVQDLALEIARQQVVGSRPFYAYGRLVTGGAATNNVVWPNGTFYMPDQTTGEDVTFVSSSVEDSATGTGVSKIEVHYLDVNLVPRAAIIQLTGTTPVTGQLSGVRFIQCMHVEELGAAAAIVTAGAGAAAGLIEAYKATDATHVYSLISAGAKRCASSLRMVPLWCRAVIAGAIGGAASGTAAARVEISFEATELDNHQYLAPFIFQAAGSIAVQDVTVPFVFPIPPIYNAGTIVGMFATTDKGAVITGDWYGWLEATGDAAINPDTGEIDYSGV